ncbi:MAG: putative metal-binding motif-containing protein, partial [Deltaproteobacteria bacterium]|nr:putative metal-binding motif-containing protein [Deltaproteobacteria bacterium]
MAWGVSLALAVACGGGGTPVPQITTDVTVAEAAGDGDAGTGDAIPLQDAGDDGAAADDAATPDHAPPDAAPPGTTLCRPCRTDDECDVPGLSAGLCVELSKDGRFCGSPCGSTACPDGFDCVPAQGTAPGPQSPQCRPAGGKACGCEGYEDVLTVCRRESALGTCTAERRCDEPCPAVEPAPETCNGRDDDCDGLTDPDGTDGCIDWHLDGDGDGYGTGDTAPRCRCGPDVAAGFVARTAGDCDDADPAAHPGATEACWGGDEDCDGKLDEPGATGCEDRYRDSDDDGYGAVGDSLCLCAVAPPYVAPQGNDCDDTLAGIHPSAPETCDGRDEDCDGETDEGTAGGACATANEWGTCPGELACTDDGIACLGPVPAPEQCNGLDDDCDGETDPEGADGCALRHADLDGDGFGAGPGRCLCGPRPGYTTVDASDCDDADEAAFPGAPETCDGSDDDCDGQADEEGAGGCVPYFTDADADGWGAAGASRCLCGPDGDWAATVAGDCDDSDPDRHPGAAAVCGKDSDCDGKAGDPGEACDDGSPTGWDGCTACAPAEFQVNLTTDGHQETGTGARRAALAKDGRFIVAWQAQGQDGSGWGVYGRRFNADGTPDGGEVALAAWTSDDQTDPTIAAYDSGYVAAWRSRGSDSDGGVFARRFSLTATAIGSEFRVHSATTGDQRAPALASLPDGRFAVAWQGPGDGAGNAVFVKRYKLDGTFSADARVNTYTTGDQTRPSVAYFPDGRFVMAWESAGQDGSGLGVYAQRFTAAGERDGAEARVNEANGGDQSRPSVAAFTDGRWAVVFQGPGGQGSGADVLLRLFAADGTPDGAEQVLGGAGDAARDPCAVAFPDGRLAVAFAAKTPGDPAAVRVESLPAAGADGWVASANTWTPGVRERPSLAAFPDGRLLP